MMTVLLLALSASAADVPGDEAGWNKLTSKPVPIECATISGKPWCRSQGLVHAPIAQVADALKNMRTNADLFESVLEINILSEDTVHIVLDYPSPLDDRDYVAKYTYSNEGDVERFTWVPVTHAGAPTNTGNVRLPNFAGEWRLQPMGDKTLVRYTWQAEINGSFPAFAYKTAWKKAGHEALKDLANTQKAELSVP